MRHLLNIVVSVVLLVSTTGIIINKHYSGGELFSAALFVDAKSCCETTCCHHEHQNNCHDESDFYKLIADYMSPDKPVVAQEPAAEVHIHDFACSLMATNPLSAERTVWIRPCEHAPPLIEDIPVFCHSLLL